MGFQSSKDNRPRVPVLIPLNSGHGFSEVRLGHARSRGLNPFEFRAWVFSLKCGNVPTTKVLIPLNSGHGFSVYVRQRAPRFLVLIPLNSGHGFSESERFDSKLFQS